ncbi:MAG: tail fiber domain-containing protein, partial [Bacteroidia bacterium]
AGTLITTGSNNTFLGTQSNVATANDTALTKSVAIGYNAKVGASSSLVLGGTGIDGVNVGINTTTPANKLEIVHGTAGNSGLRLTSLINAGVLSTNATGDVVNNTTPSPANGLFWGLTGNSGTNRLTDFIGTSDNNSLRFRVNNIQRMILDSLGNVGIRRATPSAALDVSGGIRFESATPTNANGVAYLNQMFDYTHSFGTFKINHYGLTVGPYPVSAATYLSGYGELALFTNGLNRFHITSAGNVGIGTTTPTTKLAVSNGYVNILSNSSTSGYNYHLIFSRSFGTEAVPTDVGVNEPMGAMLFNNFQSGSYKTGAVITGYTDPTAAVGVSGRPSNLFFQTNDGASLANKMTIQYNGNVGIGTSTPTDLLTVAKQYSTYTPTDYLFNIKAANSIAPRDVIRGSYAFDAGVFEVGYYGMTTGRVVIDGGTNSSGTSVNLYNSTNTLTTSIKSDPLAFTYFNANNVGIGTATPTQKLHVIGNILASGTITPSDVRYKQNIVTLNNSLSNVLKLRGVTYDMKAEYKDKGFGTGTQIGVIAQEVEAVYPALINTSTDGYKGVDYSKFTPILIEAIKEQQAQIQAQQQQINVINAKHEKELQELKRAIELLQKK